MTDLFDGLDEIFAAEDVFGEPVVYVPKATGVPLGDAGTILAIWVERPIDVIQGEADTTATAVTLHVPAATIIPVEGDTAQRVKTGRQCRVVEPVHPDGQGMVAAALEDLG